MHLRRTALAAAALSATFALGACQAPPVRVNPVPTTTAPSPVRVITFPVQGTVRFTDTFGAARSAGRTHAGTDIMGTKMQPLIAAASGTITILRHDTTNATTAGNWIEITDADGWKYRYMHMNNDTPNTDDGKGTFEQAFAKGLKVGSKVKAGDVVGYLGDSGNAEDTSPHLHFEMHDPKLGVVNPYPSLVVK